LVKDAREKIKIKKMKFKIIVIFFMFSFGCKAQSGITDITLRPPTPLPNIYYKDLNNNLDPYVGTWIYTNGTTSLKIVFQKAIKASAGGIYFQDLLIGEYQYIENGVDKTNTLTSLNTNYANKMSHHIDGNSIIDKTNKPQCLDCLATEKRIRMSFTDPIRHLGGSLIVRRITAGGQPAIKIFLKMQTQPVGSNLHTPSTVTYDNMLVPSGEYILLKQ
jgi:hypothetical protein